MKILPKLPPLSIRLTTDECRRAVEWGFKQGLLSIRPVTAAERAFIAAKLGLRQSSLPEDVKAPAVTANGPLHAHDGERS
jgi:hypothetical protein